MDAGPLASSRPFPLRWKFSARSLVGRALYRLTFVVSGVIWVGLAATFCGCSHVNGWVMNESGQAYYKRGNYTAARYEFERALMDNPYNANYAYNVAKAMEKQGQLQQAEQMYQHALALNPSHQPSYHGLSEMLIVQGRQHEAQQLLQAWAETQPYSPAAQIELAALERQMGNPMAAQQRLQTALQMQPHHPQALAEMGQLYQAMGQPQMAASYFDQSLSANPFQAEVVSQRDAIKTAHTPSAALQMASYMPQNDPTMANAPALAGYQMQGMTSPMMASPGMPMMMDSQMMATPGYAMPPGAVMSQGIQHNTMMPVQGFSAPQMMSTPVPQQYSVQPGMGQPVELGQPVPITQVYPSTGQPMMGQPMMGQPVMMGTVPVVPAF